MITDKEIKTAFQKIFNDENLWSAKEGRLDASLSRDKKRNNFEVELAKSYSRPDVTFATLKEISRRFGTDDINLSDGDSYSGCETCDFGSSYSVIIQVNNFTECDFS